MRFFLIFLSVTFYCFSQDVRKVNIVYDVIYGGMSNKEYLSSFNDKIISFSDPYISEESRSFDKNNNLHIKRSAELPQISYFKKALSDTIMIKFHTETEIIALDKLPPIDWRIHEEKSKQIGGYTCKFATAQFRGNDIYAFYTTDIPISLGPWKFHGLPGAILECGSIDLRNIWKAAKIEISNQALVRQEFVWDVKATPFKQLIINEQKRINEHIKRQRAKLPKGYQPSQSTSTIKRLGVEQVYEWELEESDKN